ncbi:hypothetical protein FHW58_004035 [Duganella sp. 1224]|uniref:hypothetical protein n=1 Tax=Duganella sp. 1224 TaxID=2587052 RepID=UPI0015C740DF|nr:hypothetical protein [Duganella sp. 1224]NYE62816.1 hypothetical protein [Duganella sp. 1224]
MKKPLAATFLLAMCGFSPAMAQEQPPANFDNWGVCPFECCTYRDWTAEAAVPVHASRSELSPITFQLKPHEHVDALTGVVVTEKAGVIRVNRPVRDGYLPESAAPQLSLKAGDIVYLLAPLGEGAYLYWYRGKVYRSGPDMAAMPGVDGKAARMTWWKLVRNHAGKMGWTTSNKFSNADSCG